MNLFISEANSIHFAQRDSSGNKPTIPNQETRLTGEEKFAGFTTKDYCQLFEDDDVVSVQVGSNDSTTPTINVYQPELGTPITPTAKPTYVTDSDPDNWRYYWEFDVDFSSYTNKTIQIQVIQNTDIYLSEKLKGEDLSEDFENGNILKYEWGNAEKPSDYRNFQLDYTTGIEFFMYVNSLNKDFEMGVDEDVFIDISQQVLLEAQLIPKYVIKTEPIPRFLARKIVEASRHFYFKVNNLKYVADGEPDIEPTNTNFVSLTQVAADANSLAFNTDNREIEGVTMDTVLTRKKEDLTSTWTFEVPEGYILHAIYADHAAASAAASYTFKVGYTVGGDDIIPAFTTNIVKTDPVRPFTLHEQKTFDAAITIYVEIVVGVGAIGRIYANLLLNT